MLTPASLLLVAALFVAAPPARAADAALPLVVIREDPACAVLVDGEPLAASETSVAPGLHHVGVVCTVRAPPRTEVVQGPFAEVPAPGRLVVLRRDVFVAVPAGSGGAVVDLRGVFSHPAGRPNIARKGPEPRLVVVVPRDAGEQRRRPDWPWCVLSLLPRADGEPRAMMMPLSHRGPNDVPVPVGATALTVIEGSTGSRWMTPLDPGELPAAVVVDFDASRTATAAARAALSLAPAPPMEARVELRACLGRARWERVRGVSGSGPYCAPAAPALAVETTDYGKPYDWLIPVGGALRTYHADSLDERGAAAP